MRYASDVPSRLRRIGRRLPTLYLIVALILGSALALGRYSFRNAQRLADEDARSVAEYNKLVVEQTVLRVDNFIIDSDRSLFDLVDLEHLQDFNRRWGEIVRLSKPVEAAIVLDEKYQVMRNGYASKRGPADADTFLKVFSQKIQPKLPLADLPVDLHKHWHDRVDGRDYLISYIKRELAHVDGTKHAYYIVLKISLDYLRNTFFPETFKELHGSVLYAVLDEEDEVVFGERVSAPEPFLYEKGFPTTLYQWRLQMAPPEAARNVAKGRAQRVSETTLIALMVGSILVGMVFLIVAIGRERRANQLKSDFISNVSHELKTPLSLIRMFGELLALGKLKTPEKGREYAEIITRESERLSRLIDNVLDFARIERGKAAYDFKHGDLGEVVARAIDVIRYRLEREGVKLAVAIDEEIPETELDENAMTLVLLNLLDNAVKYGGDKPEISVALRRDGTQLKLAVSDKGPGIARDEQRRIFDRFYRARSARGKSARGSGIGLSLVKHIAEAHGGRVTVESEPGQGATFTVIIPIVDAPHPAPDAAEVEVA